MKYLENKTNQIKKKKNNAHSNQKLIIIIITKLTLRIKEIFTNQVIHQTLLKCSKFNNNQNIWSKKKCRIVHSNHKLINKNNFSNMISINVNNRKDF